MDAFIARNHIDAPEESIPVLNDGYGQEEPRTLDLLSAGVNTIIWATGYAFDFNLVRLPVVDEDGYPIQKKGVTAYPGLYFIGLPWLNKQKSGLLVGIGEDAENLACVINTWG